MTKPMSTLSRRASLSAYGSIASSPHAGSPWLGRGQVTAAAITTVGTWTTGLSKKGST